MITAEGGDRVEMGVFLLATHEAKGNQEAHCLLKHTDHCVEGEPPEGPLAVRDSVNDFLRTPAWTQDFQEKMARTVWRPDDPEVKRLLSTEESEEEGKQEEEDREMQEMRSHGHPELEVSFFSALLFFLLSGITHGNGFCSPGTCPLWCLGSTTLASRSTLPFSSGRG